MQGRVVVHKRLSRPTRLKSLLRHYYLISTHDHTRSFEDHPAFTPPGYSHGAVVADVVVERFPPGATLRTFGQPAADLVRGGPHHLRVVPDAVQIVPGGAVREVLPLQKPRP